MAQQVDKKPKLVQRSAEDQQELVEQQIKRYVRLVEAHGSLTREHLKFRDETHRHMGSLITLSAILALMCIAEFIVFWFIW